MDTDVTTLSDIFALFVLFGFCLFLVLGIEAGLKR
jgi:hypothetical protein